MDTEKTITLPDGTVARPVKLLSDKQSKQLYESLDSYEHKNYMVNQIRKQTYDNLGLNNKPDVLTPEERLHFLTSKLDSVQSELKSQTESMIKVQYENMMLNSQIEVLNKNVDSYKDELTELQKANSNLKNVNQTLKDSNKHYWLYTALIAIGSTVLGIILGHYF